MRYIYKDQKEFGFQPMTSVESYLDLLSGNYPALIDKVNMHYSCHHVKVENPANREFSYGDLMFWDIDYCKDHELILKELSKLINVPPQCFSVIDSGNYLNQ